MAKLKSFIKSNGIFLGRGISRQAYLYNNEVYKMSYNKYDGFNQNVSEIDNIATIHNTYGYMDILPKCELINNQIVKMELVEVADADNLFSGYCRKHEKIRSLTSYIQYCRTCKDDFQHHRVEEELNNVSHIVADIDDNVSNFGYSNGFIKIIDLGIHVYIPYNPDLVDL